MHLEKNGSQEGEYLLQTRDWKDSSKWLVMTIDGYIGVLPDFDK